MEDIIVGGIAAAAAVFGFSAHAVYTLVFGKKEVAPSATVTTSEPTYSYASGAHVDSTETAVSYQHEHDWHIREKRAGKVIQYCLSCGTERERP